jgi:hypothetical protein
MLPSASKELPKEENMQSVVGIFASRTGANRAVEELIQSGVSPEHIIFLSGERPGAELSAVPTTDTEGDGMGKAMGSVVGGATGASAGLGLGSAVASLMVPGVGPIVAAGIGAAALLGIGGAAAGAKIGDNSEHQLDTGVPRDDVEFYRELLRQGRALVIVEAGSDNDVSRARRTLDGSGAENVDHARKQFGRAA